ncbi:hypothetical protein [Pontivivens ytuae]|uniref:THAP4-like heme-binding beta-barrel domain-containing protein n=1 Tax=Pontivivens ytuae TaxID=2789856 RepID=A0A7S9QDJ0_9RHOB|nr:hypothetical protein [Pontivivens ytuae]QPH55338.1 hypothetical protein I0K15_06255 [Pontivivens ytuae]
MSDAFTSLTGRWSGTYAYPRGLADPVHFAADLVEEDGTIRGQVVEPNTIVPGGPKMLDADLHGERTGREVTFSKTYTLRFRHHALVHYEGTASADLGTITGRWVILGPHALSGRFSMRRPAREARKVEMEDSVEV